MPAARTFDVVVVGGGIASSAIGGLLARAGLGVLVVERAERFRDRIRGEGTWPWGTAAAYRAGLAEMLQPAIADVLGLQRFENRVSVATYVWSDDSIDGVSEMTFYHPHLQETAFRWAEMQGATTLRPAKAVAYTSNGKAAVTVTHGGEDVEYAARLVIGADGKLSGVRRWTGGESVADPEHHRMGGVLVTGADIDRSFDNYSRIPGLIVNWFPAGTGNTRIYLVMSAERLRETGVDRSFEAVVEVALTLMPEGSLDGAEQAGPIGYFPNNDIWANRIAGNKVVLIGDAAGAPDPTQGHGTSLLFHDVWALSELLLNERDWDRAIEVFAERRSNAFDVVLQYDRWTNMLRDEGPEADRLRAGHERAQEADPTLGGFNLLEARGPEGLVADEAARRHYFGQDLPN